MGSILYPIKINDQKMSIKCPLQIVQAQCPEIVPKKVHFRDIHNV
jgi:hypothetical protein